jgi:archaellum component FlaC
MEAMRQSWSDDRLDDLNVKVDRGFEQIDKRFEAVDRRFEQVDKRFEQVDRRFEQVDKRFEQVDKRFDEIDRRFEKVNDEFVAVRREMKEGFESLHKAIIQVLITMVTFMAAGFSGLIVLIATQL